MGGQWGEGGDTHGRMAQLLLSLGIQYITAAKKYIVFTSQVTCKLKPSVGNNPSEQWILKIITWSLLKPKGPDFFSEKTSTQHIIQLTNFLAPPHPGQMCAAIATLWSQSRLL